MAATSHAGRRALPFFFRCRSICLSEFPPKYVVVFLGLCFEGGPRVRLGGNERGWAVFWPNYSLFVGLERHSVRSPPRNCQVEGRTWQHEHSLIPKVFFVTRIRFWSQETAKTTTFFFFIINVSGWQTLLKILNSLYTQGSFLFFISFVLFAPWGKAELEMHQKKNREKRVSQ